MADKEKKEFISNYALRFRPDFRYTDNKKSEISLKLYESDEPSITDKEAYRVTLSSLRGELASGSGRIDAGSYSLKAGEEYDPKKDFSFLNRKDLTLVELDEYISIMKRKLEESDAEYSEKANELLATAEKKKQTLEKETVNKNDNVGGK